MAASEKLGSNFWRQLVATGVSNIGDGMVHAAAPLLTLSLTDDPRLIAGVSFSSMLPWLVLTLPAGVYIDRFNRQHLMIAANVIRAALYALIAVAAATDSLNIWTFMLVLLGVGACEVIFDMTAQAFLPQIVRNNVLERANGRLTIVETICNNFIGLPLGAIAFVVAASIPFGVNGASFGLAAVLVFSIRIPKPLTDADSLPTRNSFRSDFKEGFSWLWNNHLIRTLAIMLGVTNMAVMFGDAIFVKYAADELGVTGSGYGFLLSLMAIGSIIGGFLGERISKRLGVGLALIISYAIFGLVGLAYIFMPNVWVIAVAVSIMGIAGTTWNVVTVSLRQRIIPAELFGRVNSVYRFLGTGSIALGAIAGGQIAYRFGIRAPYLASVIVGLSSLAIGGPRLYKEVQRYIAPEETPAPPSIT